MTSDWIKAEQEYGRAYRAANLANKETVFDALQKAGVTSVTVTFDGEGDSGQIEDVTFETTEDTDFESQVTILNRITILSVHSLPKSDGGGCSTIESESSIRDAVESLCYFLLGQDNGGWENNEGAYGEFTFNVAARTIDLDFNTRITSSEHSSYSY
jgi:hypothetical protein